MSRGGVGAYIAAMRLLAAAKPWTYWVSPVLVIGAILAIVGVLVGYVVKVVSLKYPRQ